MMIFKRWSAIKRLRSTKLLVMDCDGTITDGILPGKRFCTKDGCGIRLLKLEKAVVSGDEFDPEEIRARHLGINHLRLGAQDKWKVVQELADCLGINYKDICYIGDDINDLECIKKCGVGVAVGDAVREVKRAADITTRKAGGHGAIRELTDLIRSVQNESLH